METFRTFKDRPAAEDLAIWLADRGVDAEFRDISPPFDPTFANSILTKEWAVSLAPAHFEKATALLRAFYEQRLTGVPADYYLFAFSDSELTEVLQKPDEWGDLDYALAQVILAKRGHNYSEDDLDTWRALRYEALKQPDSVGAKGNIRWGYFFALAVPLIGALLGYHTLRAQKILPDGKKVYRFDAPSRRHGLRILCIGITLTIVFLMARLWQQYNWYVI